MNIRDRVKELRRVPAKTLLPNKKNWRKHSRQQREALEGILSEVGFADALIAYETPKGLQLIDGHLRASSTPDALVPVLVLDVNEVEADKLLVTLDPLAAMAKTDGKLLTELIGSLHVRSAALAEMLAGLNESAARQTFQPELTPEAGNKLVGPKDIADTEEKLTGRFLEIPKNFRDVCCPSCGAEFSLDVEG